MMEIPPPDPGAADEANIDPTNTHLAMFTIVLPDHQVLYTWTPKVACTSMKWLLADAIGLKEQSTLEPFTSSSLAMTIHDRNRFPFRSLADLGSAERKEVLTSNQWLRFCVVRDPFARVFSAWSHMVLLREPHMLESFNSYPFDRSDRSRDLGARFEAFLRLLSRDRDRWFQDGHFATQASIVRPDAIPYTEIVRMEALADFEPTLTAHLRRAGASPGPLGRTNEGIRLPFTRNYSDESVSIVCDLYALDFELFGYPTSFNSAGYDPTVLTETELAFLDEIQRRNERIYALVTSGKRAGGTHGIRLLARAMRRRASSISVRERFLRTDR